MTGANRFVSRAKLSDAVVERLEGLITSGEYPVGSKLPNEKVLAQEFGVGRSSTREAVRTLEAAGMLRSVHGVGVFVETDRRGSPGLVDQSLMGGFTMSDLFETRMALESKAAELAAVRLTDHHADRLQEIVAAAAAPGIPEQEFVVLDGRLHRQVAEASGNPLLLHLWESIAAQFEQYSMRVIGLPGRLERAHADHCGIVAALVDRDPALAARRAHEHVATVQREVQQATPRP
jgi:GntR family transcriptional repressor for pyruvate dehydrogenase complex